LWQRDRRTDRQTATSYSAPASSRDKRIQTWLIEKVVSINNNGLLAELVDGNIEQLVQLFKSYLTRVEVIPTCRYE